MKNRSATTKHKRHYRQPRHDDQPIAIVGSVSVYDESGWINGAWYHAYAMECSHGDAVSSGHDEARITDKARAHAATH